MVICFYFNRFNLNTDPRDPLNLLNRNEIFKKLYAISINARLERLRAWGLTRLAGPEIEINDAFEMAKKYLSSVLLPKGLKNIISTPLKEEGFQEIILSFEYCDTISQKDAICACHDLIDLKKRMRTACFFILYIGKSKEISLKNIASVLFFTINESMQKTIRDLRLNHLIEIEIEIEIENNPSI